MLPKTSYDKELRRIGVACYHISLSPLFQGYISRQEGVSMIPPLLLDIQPHHTVSRNFSY